MIPHWVAATGCFRILRVKLLRNHEKIGQCAIGLGIGRAVFGDGLQLLPDCRCHWAECMAALFDMLGDRRYSYGSRWSIEPPRERELAQFQGVSVIAVDRRMVEAVDFARWATWPDYVKAISTNVRRNMKRAKAEQPDLYIETKHGLGAMFLARQLYRCKSEMRARKGIARNIRVARRHMIRLLLMRDYASCSVLYTEKQVPVAAFGGAEIGHNAYYFDGGTRAADGTGWVLMIALMEDFFKQHPTGRFLFGTEHRTADIDPQHYESPFRYRRDARVSAFPTSVVTFTYRR